jgi:dTDP-glucose 4,6-dehydratase
VFRELPVDDPKVRQPDIGLAEKILEWSPRVQRRDGLRRTLAYFEKRIAPARGGSKV